MRLIDADAFNEYLKDEYHGAISDSQLYIYQILRLIDNVPTVHQANGWMSVADRLPVDNEHRSESPEGKVAFHENP